MGMGFKSRCMEIPSKFDEEFSIERIIDYRYSLSYTSQIDEDFSSDEHLGNDGHFLSAPEDIGRPDPSPNFSDTVQHSNKGIRLVTGRKYRKKYYSRMQ